MQGELFAVPGTARSWSGPGDTPDRAQRGLSVLLLQHVTYPSAFPGSHGAGGSAPLDATDPARRNSHGNVTASGKGAHALVCLELGGGLKNVLLRPKLLLP